MTNSNVNGNVSTNDINAIRSPVAKPRGDKNYMRVMELEKEVLELYKMLDYWKNEAKTMQEDHAESNIKLKDQVRGQKLLLAIRRVVHKHTAKGFHRFADNSLSKRQVLLKQRVTTETFEARESTHMESDTLDSPSINMSPSSKIGGASSARSSSRIKLRVRSTS